MASEPELRPEPPKVYPALDAGDRWIVEAPSWSPPQDGQGEPQSSRHGTAALALRYAYETYGRARFFSS